MKSKLIILNGPCGIGKNTIAERYGEDNPLTLILDVDQVRRFISQYQEHRETSGKLARDLAQAMASEYLQAGRNVIIPSALWNVELLEAFESIAEEGNSEFIECMLWADKEAAINRATQRGISEGGSLTLDKAKYIYDQLEKVKDKRKNLATIESIEGEIEQTYRKFVDIIA